jgi:hypothetical protein
MNLPNRDKSRHAKIGLEQAENGRAHSMGIIRAKTRAHIAQIQRENFWHL